MSEEQVAGSVPAEEQSGQPAASPTEGENSGGTLLTNGLETGKEEAEGQPKETAAETENDKAGAEAVPESPEGYKLTFAEGIEVDTALQGKFQAVAHELKLTNTQAQKLGDMWAAHTGESVKAAEEAQIAAYKQSKEKWESDIKASPTFEADLGYAQNALTAYGSPELVDVMEQTMIGSFPAFFNFVAKVGKELAEPKMQGQTESGQNKVPLPDRLWPDMK